MAEPDRREPSEAPAGIHLRLQAAEAYRPSPVVLSAWSYHPFALEVSYVQGGSPVDVIACAAGLFTGPERGTVKAIPDESRFVLEVTVAGAFRPETLTKLPSRRGRRPSLGARWFPFVASRMALVVVPVAERIISVEFSLSPDLRIRSGFDVPRRLDPEIELSHNERLEPEGWAYTLWWPRDTGSDCVLIDVPVQIAPVVVGRYVYTAALSLLFALAAIAVAGHLDKASHFVAAAFGGYLVLLARQWSQIPRISHLTALGAIYGACGLLAIPWALGWGHQDPRTWFELAILVPWGLGLISMATFFAVRGRPPMWFAWGWHALSRPFELARDSLQERWRLRAALEGFKGADAVVEDSTATSVTLRVVIDEESGDVDCVRVIRSGDDGFDVERQRGRARRRAHVYTPRVVARAIRRTGADNSVVATVVQQHFR